MKRFQRTLSAAIATAALAGSFTIAAHAQTAAAPTAAPAAATAPAPAVHHQGKRAHKTVDFAKVHAERAAHLKTILQLQPKQQADWDKYVQATTPAPRNHAESKRPDMRKLTTPERLDHAQQLRKARTAKAEQREQATRSFYSSLTTSQQQAFDAVTAQRHGKHFAGTGKAHHRGQHHGHNRATHSTGAPAV